MKFTLTVSYLIILSAAVAVVSTEAISQREKHAISDGLMTSDAAPLAAVSRHLRRRLEEDADEDQNDAQDEEDGDNESADEDEDADADEDEDEDEAEESEDEDEESGEEEEESEDEEGDDEASEDAASGDENDAGDEGYDEAVENCEEGDEDCESAADRWDIQNYTDKYNSMSKTSKIWFIALAVWFALLGIFTAYLCCFRKGYVSKSASLEESLIEDKKDEPTPASDGKVSAWE